MYKGPRERFVFDFTEDAIMMLGNGHNDGLGTVPFIRDRCLNEYIELVTMLLSHGVLEMIKHINTYTATIIEDENPQQVVKRFYDPDARTPFQEIYETYGRRDAMMFADNSDILEAYFPTTGEMWDTCCDYTLDVVAVYGGRAVKRVLLELARMPRARFESLCGDGSGVATQGSAMWIDVDWQDTTRVWPWKTAIRIFCNTIGDPVWR